jgi:hypothetical protein
MFDQQLAGENLVDLVPGATGFLCVLFEVSVKREQRLPQSPAAPARPIAERIDRGEGLVLVGGERAAPEEVVLPGSGAPDTSTRRSALRNSATSVAKAVRSSICAIDAGTPSIQR